MPPRKRVASPLPRRHLHDSKPLRGGKFVGEGTSGCVFTPRLKEMSDATASSASGTGGSGIGAGAAGGGTGAVDAGGAGKVESRHKARAEVKDSAYARALDPQGLYGVYPRNSDIGDIDYASAEASAGGAAELDKCTDALYSFPNGLSEEIRRVTRSLTAADQGKAVGVDGEEAAVQIKLTLGTSMTQAVLAGPRGLRALSVTLRAMRNLFVGMCVYHDVDGRVQRGEVPSAPNADDPDTPVLGGGFVHCDIKPDNVLLVAKSADDVAAAVAAAESLKMAADAAVAASTASARTSASGKPDALLKSRAIDAMNAATVALLATKDATVYKFIDFGLAYGRFDQFSLMEWDADLYAYHPMLRAYYFSSRLPPPTRADKAAAAAGKGAGASVADLTEFGPVITAVTYDSKALHKSSLRWLPVLTHSYDALAEDDANMHAAFGVTRDPRTEKDGGPANASSIRHWAVLRASDVYGVGTLLAYAVHTTLGLDRDALVEVDGKLAGTQVFQIVKQMTEGKAVRDPVNGADITRVVLDVLNYLGALLHLRFGEKKALVGFDYVLARVDAAVLASERSVALLASVPSDASAPASAPAPASTTAPVAAEPATVTGGRRRSSRGTSSSSSAGRKRPRSRGGRED